MTDDPPTPEFNSIDEGSFSSLNEFDELLKSQIKVSNRNKELLKKLRIESERPIVNSTLFSPATFADINRKEYSKNIRRPIQLETESNIKPSLNPSSYFLPYIVNGKSLKNMLPDFEYIKSFQFYSDPAFSPVYMPDFYFFLAKLKTYEGDFSKALFYITKVESESKDVQQIKLWKFLVSIYLASSFPLKAKSKSFFCCTNRDELTRPKYLKKLVKDIKKYPVCIESLWSLMEISMMNVLKVGKNIECSRYYATKIKTIDKYYGYLAWACISIDENSSDALEILKSIISQYSERPEAYYIIWRYYYTTHNYNLARDIASEAFLKVIDTDCPNYHVLFSLKLAKSYYLTNKFQSCLELLHLKFIDYPEYPVFLYYFCKYSVQSEDVIMTGIAKGILKELFRLCDNTREGNIYYWLSRAYMQSKEYPKAYRCAFNAVASLDIKERNKINEMKKIMYDMKVNMDRIEKLETKIQNETIDNQLWEKIDELKDFHKPSGEILTAKAYIAQNNKVKAIETIRNMLVAHENNMTGYFLLLKIESISNEVLLKEMLVRAQSPQVPTQTWVKCALLYTKYLFHIFDYDKAFYVLRLCAKLLPPLPYANIPYCISLQNSETYEELSVAYLEVLRNPLSGQKKLTLIGNVQELTIRILEDANKYKGSTKNMSKTNSLKSSGRSKNANTLGLQLEYDELNQISLPSPLPTDRETSGFNICSKPKFLYYICKFSVLMRKNKQEATMAITEFKELTKLDKYRCKIDKRLAKARSLLEELKNFD
ncbi:hypothetical protein SteCoe_5389 [Stentor coeruleus]|uniref:Uncharacterized protein n=1 Tax=Stentor coeruleus TaxID=5963 RepID=A0A1R2CSJ6_9CILI|nr:hypothetical protein SteCoe_5389 [Stentor coeruleus]